ncbi:hypothetical protein BX666DRAFT_2030237 [Dichotomocladium elegans]|nr:hypothetical protein BX666DRAFT_2030237 [Dichotomocladium elegans]
MLAASTVMLVDQRTPSMDGAGTTTARRNSFTSFVRTLLLMVNPPSNGSSAPHGRGAESSSSSPLDNVQEQCVDYKNSLFLEMYYSFPALDETEIEAPSPVVAHCATADRLLPPLTSKRVVC